MSQKTWIKSLHYLRTIKIWRLLFWTHFSPIHTFFHAVFHSSHLKCSFKSLWENNCGSFSMWGFPFVYCRWSVYRSPPNYKEPPLPWKIPVYASVIPTISNRFCWQFFKDSGFFFIPNISVVKHLLYIVSSLYELRSFHIAIFVWAERFSHHIF